MKLDSAMFTRDEAGAARLDAVQSAFFARELEEIDGQMYDVKYADLEAFQLVGTRKLSPGAETYTYRQFDSRGVAIMTSNYASASPRADVDGQEFTSKVRGIRASYGYNVQEIRAASEANRPLENMRAVAARRAINEKINHVALLGDADNGIVGLFNQTGFQAYTIPAGASTQTDWPHKTGAEILDDMYGMVDQIPTATKEVEKPKRMLIPYSRLRYISRKRAFDNSAANDTVLAVFKENRPQIEVRGALFLDTAGAGGTARAMVYDPAQENLELLLPIPFESFPPERKGMEWVVENHARMGGVVVRYPLSALYADGI